MLIPKDHILFINLFIFICVNAVTYVAYYAHGGHRTTLLLFYEVHLWNKTAVTTPNSRKLPNDQKPLGMPSSPQSWSRRRETHSGSAELSSSFLATMYQSIRLPNTHTLLKTFFSLCVNFFVLKQLVEVRVEHWDSASGACPRGFG